MALKASVDNDLKAALISGNRFVVEVLRGLKAAILNEEVAAGKRESGLDDETIEKVIAREVKKRHESAKIYRDNNRPELAEPEEKEAEVLAAYLPEQLDEQALEVIIATVIADLNPDGMKDMGKVIGAVKAKAGNTADGALIAQKVKQLLQT